jgi:hypothetical protein
MECVVEVAARSQVEERRGPAFMPRIRLNLRQGEDEHVFSTASFRKREERRENTAMRGDSIIFRS